VQFGSYKITQELSSHGHVSAFLAEHTGGDGPATAVVKRLKTSEGAEHENPDELILQFLDAARSQQRVARSSVRWANVVETGVAPGGAFFAAEHCSRSVQTLLDTHVPLSAPQIQALIMEAVAGLVDLRQVSERPHGNLKASNILLRDHWPAAGGLAMCDLVPAARLEPHHARDDLEALGRILYQLVTRSPVHETVFWPVDESVEWTELGRGSESLRALCNLLLDPDATPEAKFEKLHQQAAGRQRVRKAMKLSAAAVVVALLCVPAWVYGKKFVGRATPAGNETALDTSFPTPTTQSHRDDRVATNVTTTRDTTPRDPVRHLMAATNPTATFSVHVTAEPYQSEVGNGPCIALTVTPDADCYVMILCRDASGKISLIVPNSRWDKAPRLWRGQALAVQSMGFELPVEPPYGKTTFKVIATVKRVELVGALPNSLTGFLEGGDGFRLEGVGRTEPAGTLAELLKANEWATAQAEIVTRPPSEGHAMGMKQTEAVAVREWNDVFVTSSK
jgi:hypothetical protein